MNELRFSWFVGEWCKGKVRVYVFLVQWRDLGLHSKAFIFFGYMKK